MGKRVFGLVAEAFAVRIVLGGVSFAALSLSTVGTALAVTISNGGFEAVQIGLPFYSSSPADIPGWTHGGVVGDALIWNAAYTDAFGIGHAGEGDQWVTMGGGFNAPPATSSWSNTMTGLVVGELYSLNFLLAYEANPFQPPAPNTVTVSIVGGPTASFSTGPNGGPAYWGTWQPFSLSFVATSASQGFTFSSTGSYDVGLDGVNASVASVPLPAALQLFGSVLGIGGLLGWRKKRKAPGRRSARPPVVIDANPR